MTDRPPVDLHDLSTSTYFPTLPEQLVSLGTVGPNDMGFIRQLYPIETVVFERAINEFARRIDLLPTTTTDGAELVADAQRCLGLTLVPFARRFLASGGLDRDGAGPDDEATDRFRELARGWALAQLRSCCAATAALIVADYLDSLRAPLIERGEAAHLEELGRQIEHLERRPDAKPLVAKLREAYTQLANLIESRIAIDPVVARSLSYLLASTSGGLLTDNAVAALIMKGNNSPGARAIRNPLQLLDVKDVAKVFETSERSITNMVSKFRRNAMEHPDVSHFAPAFDVTQLWIRIEPGESIGSDRAADPGRDRGRAS
jgi:hypothetical protein